MDGIKFGNTYTSTNKLVTVYIDDLSIDDWSSILRSSILSVSTIYESFSDVGEIRVWWRADFQSGSRVFKKEF